MTEDFSYLAEAGTDKGNLIRALQMVQNREGYVSDDAVRTAAAHFDIPEAEVEGVLTFYAQFKRVKPGRFQISICDGTACHIKGSTQVAAWLNAELGIGDGQTTEDGIFSIETVACLGCCSLAPVMSINGMVHGKLDRKKITKILNDYRKLAETAESGANADVSDTASNDFIPAAGIKRVKVGMASCGIAAGAGAVMDELKKYAGALPVTAVGCIGHCYAEPVVEVELTDNTSVFYSKVTAAMAKNILSLGGENRFAVPEKRAALEKILVTRLAGRIDPVNLDEYRANGGFSALEKVMAMTPADVVEAVKASGLRGRGGAGFSTGMKWSFLAAKDSPEKVLICNADEGDPGAFMDRSMMESVPFQLLEGMLIGAYATGATKLFIYCRAEYPLAIANLKCAIESMYGAGLNKLPGQTVEIVIKEGAGAFVCGEETAMIHSLEGKRGTPRFRPPFPTDSGWNGLPTAINNVETFSNIPVIFRMGAEAFAATGTEKSKGTKIFALAGDLNNPGLTEVPMGVTLAEIVYDIGGAEPGSVKAVQTGGPSGGCIPAEQFDVKIDYDSLGALGAIMGSGGLIAIGKNRCMVETARYFLSFTKRESCGKCTFCRVGTTRMFEALERITSGTGTDADIALLEDLALKVKKGSLCGLGQTAPNPALSTLRYFRNEYEEHVRNHACSALVCSPLVKIKIDHSKCIKCKLCAKKCPAGAIDNASLTVNNDLCTRCDSCIEICPKNAIARIRKDAE